jgi:hypothetical protein
VKNFLYALYELCVSCEVCTLGPTTEYRYTQSGNGLSGVHSIMKEKLAQLVRVGGARPPRYHHLQSCSVPYASAERADTLPLFHLYSYMYSVNPTTETVPPLP